MTALKYIVVFALLLLAKTHGVTSEGEDSKDSATEEVVETAAEQQPAEGEDGKDKNDKPVEENDVLVLTSKNFDSVVNGNTITLVEFYAPWCGHCKQLAPEYEKAAKKLKEFKHPVVLAKVDATVESDLASRFGVQGYPTLKIFRKDTGTAFDYDGPRNEAGIVEHMQEQADPDWKPPPEEVLTLTKDNFTEITTREELMLVEFYAPWCGHCKQLAPEYEKAAQALKKLEQPILLAKVDGTQESELAQQYGVSGYPTMKVFRKGKASEYKGGRDENGIVSYMESQVGISSVLKSTVKDVKGFLKGLLDDCLILGVFENEEDPMFKAYLEANNDLRDSYQFAHTFDKNVMDTYKLKGSAVLLFHPEHLLSKYEPKFHALTNAKAEPKDMVEFYEKHQAPLVGYFQSHTEKRFKKPLIIVFYDVNFSPEYRSMTQFWRKKVVEVANDFPQFQFAVADEESFTDRLKDLKLTESGEDVNVGLYDDKSQKFAMEEEFSEDNLRDFIQQYLDGSLKPIIKSQMVPSKNDGPVKIVVGDSFEKIVLDSGKDVLIEFYAPWCGHCKSLEPIYKKLGEKYKNEKKLVIAKMDSTANDAPPAFTIEGFPTIYFAPADKKDKPIKFEGDRDLAGLSKFIEEHATVTLGKSSKGKKDEL